MNGIELAKAYYEQYGKPMIEGEFAEYKGRIAVGIVGHGSECFGYDDEISTDHDYEPSFCIWITEEDERIFGFPLFRAYRRLPHEFNGIKLQSKSDFGSGTKGVHTIKEFYKFYTGTGEVPQNLEHWMSIPPFYLAEATNGEVFYDPLGEFTRIRNGLLSPPEDYILKHLASSLLNMAQTGQYNYERCLQHREKTAAAITLADFAKHTAEAVFFINGKYPPYYKWLFRAMRNLPILSDLEGKLGILMQSPLEHKKNIEIINEIAFSVEEDLRKKNLTDCKDGYLERYAYSINNLIHDGALRNSSVML